MRDMEYTLEQGIQCLRTRQERRQTQEKEADALNKQYKDWGYEKNKLEYLACHGTQVEKKAAWRLIRQQREEEKEKGAHEHPKGNV